MDTMGMALKSKLRKFKEKSEGDPVDVLADFEKTSDQDPKDRAPDIEDEGESSDLEALLGEEQEDEDALSEDVLRELKLLEELSSGGARGREPISLGERAKEKMRLRMAELGKNK